MTLETLPFCLLPEKKIVFTHIHVHEVSKGEVLVPNDGLADDFLYPGPVTFAQCAVTQTDDD